MRRSSRPASRRGRGDRVPQALEGQAFFDKAFILKGGFETVPDGREAVVSPSLAA